MKIVQDFWGGMTFSFHLFVTVLLLASKAEGICNSGDVRLIGGNDYEGRVEVCIGEEWGTVCDDYFDPEDAGIVCGQLGYPRIGAVVFADSSQFGIAEFTTAILMDNVVCMGNERRLIDCNYDSDSDCYHIEDVGIHCEMNVMCDDGAVRLVNDSDETVSVVSGRVEMCLNNTWGAVCDQSWTDADATVVCKQLGFLQHVSSYSGAQGSGPILLHNAVCSGNEKRLVDCQHSDSGTCTHADDVGVICLSEPAPPELEAVKRISASQIEVTLKPDDIATAYTIKYYPLDSQNELKFLTANTTKVVIHDLDPLLSYSISVAATNAAGMGDYSNEVTVEILENRFFQIFFSGSIDCKEWTMFDVETKLEHVKNNLVSDLDSTCSKCQFTPGLELFYFNAFLCFTSHPHVIVFWGRVFGTDTCNNADIMNCLQAQVEAEFQHSVEGVSLKALDYCSVYVDEDTPSCGIREALMGEEDTSSTTPYIASIAIVGLLALTVLVMCIISTVYFRRKSHSTKLQFSQDNPMVRLDESTSRPAESLYETIFDAPPPVAAEKSAAYQVPKASVVANVGIYDNDPPTTEAKQKHDYLNIAIKSEKD